MHSAFRSKFVEYLANGIPVQISNEDKPVFYKELANFINKANNDFESFYSERGEELFISDSTIDYLTVSYEDSKIIFRTTSQTSKFKLSDPYIKHRLGEAFIGVVLFVESIAPSSDSGQIPREYHDQWCQ